MAKVLVESVGTIQRRLEVEVPADEVAEEIEKAYGRLRQSVAVRGFRRGRAPRAVLEQLFGDQVQADVFEKLVRESYIEAVRAERIEPLGQPDIVTEHAEAGQPLRFSATFEVKPTISVAGYDGLVVARPSPAVTEADVDAYVEELRQSRAQLHPLEGISEARRGDVALVDYEAHADGELIGRGEGRQILVGGETVESIGTHLIGAVVGKYTSFGIDYPPDFSEANLAGRHVVFRVRVEALSSREVPILDDDFARAVMGAETVGELRRKVQTFLSENAELAADRAARSRALERLLEIHEFEVPSVMVDRRAEALASEFLESLGPRRPPASKETEVRAHLREEFLPRAVAQVKIGLILESIAEREGIQIEEAELDREVEKLTEQSERAQRIRSAHRDPSLRAGLRASLLQERALDWVMKRATIQAVDPTSGVADHGGNG
jgi:trigger factor